MAIDFKRLEAARKDLNFTKTDMANLLGINIRTYCSYENGERDIGTAMLLHICNALAISADELLGMSVDRTRSSVATINGKLVYMIPIYELSSTEFDQDFVDCMPEFFDNMSEAKETIAIKAIGDSMYPKIEKNDIVVFRKQTHINLRNDDIILANIDGVNKIRRVNKSRNKFELEAINPVFPPKDISGDLINEVKLIGIATKLIKKL